MSLEDKLKALEKSPKFQEKVRSEMKDAHKAGKRFGQGSGSEVGVVDEKESQVYVDEILSRLKEAIKLKFPRMKDDLFVVLRSPSIANGYYEYEIQFNEKTVHRYSLYEEGYPDGLLNVVELYSHGSRPSKGMVCGDWVHDVSGPYSTYSHVYLPKGYTTKPDPFLINAINELNNEYAVHNIKIALDAKYYP